MSNDEFCSNCSKEFSHEMIKKFRNLESQTDHQLCPFCYVDYMLKRVRK